MPILEQEHFTRLGVVQEISLPPRIFVLVQEGHRLQWGNFRGCTAFDIMGSNWNSKDDASYKDNPEGTLERTS